MIFVPIQDLSTNTTSFTSPVATQMTLPSAVIAELAALLPSNNYTTIAVFDGIHYELMLITGVTAGAANITRAQQGTSAVSLASGASVRFVWTVDSIQAITGSGTPVTCTGHGAATVTGGPNYQITVPVVAITAGDGINVTGSFPNFDFTSTVPSGPSGPAGPTGASTTVAGSGIASATGSTGAYTVHVDAPNFTVGSGIGITGTWPNIQFTNTQTPGGTGTVTNVTGSTGITVVSGTTTPVISITPTGVAPGSYGGITVNTGGQITAIGTTGIVTSVTTSTTGITIGNPSVGSVTVNIGSASNATQGLVKLAPTSATGSNNPGNSADAVTPAGINSVITSLNISPASIAATGTQTPLAPGSYTTLVTGFNIPINVTAGKTAIIDLYIEVYDPSNPTVVPNFAVGLFNGGSLLAGNSNIVSGYRSLKYLVTGPLATTLIVKTTTLAGTNAVQSFYASTVGN